MLRVQKAGEGRWKIDGYVGRRRYRKTLKAASRAHAEEFAAKVAQRAFEREALGRTHDATVTECAALYLQKGGEDRFLIPIIERWGETKVQDLTEGEVAAGAQAIYPGRKASTIRRQLYVPLNAIIAAGHRANLCPPMKFEPPKVKRGVVDYADDHWQAAFGLEASFKLKAIVAFLQTTGARVTEACNLEVRDILPEGYAILRHTKNQSSRQVRLPPQMMDVLAVICDGKSASDLVFDYSGRDAVNKAIKRACERAGIRYLSSHKIGRHTFAARLLRQGESLRLVQEAGGWKSISIVASTYGHLERSQVDQAIDRLRIGDESDASS